MTLPRVNGRRGVFLLINTFLMVVIGTSYLRLPAIGSREPVFQWLPFPMSQLGWIWIFCSFVAFWSAFRQPPKSDRWGFIAAWCILGLFVGAYMSTWAISHVPSAWVTGSYYAVYGAFVVLAGGWPNPPKKVPLPRLMSESGDAE